MKFHLEAGSADPGEIGLGIVLLDVVGYSHTKRIFKLALMFHMYIFEIGIRYESKPNMRLL